MLQQPLDYEASKAPPKKARIGPLTLGALVLLIYPFCLGANVMSLAAMDAPETRVVDRLQRLSMQGFLWGSTVYPVVYLIAVGISRFLSSNDRPVGARRMAQAPLIYLLAVLLCFVTCYAL
jgi:hypothetical protein